MKKSNQTYQQYFDNLPNTLTANSTFTLPEGHTQPNGTIHEMQLWRDDLKTANRIYISSSDKGGFWVNNPNGLRNCSMVAAEIIQYAFDHGMIYVER